jgi:tetratricopeptide (TPR) repeat protein
MDIRPKLIVLPLQPDKDQEYNGIGLGIHFLLGNMMAIHPELAEFWFGWRANKIFKSVSEFQAFCRGNNDIDLNRVAKEQKIRFWLYGRYRQKKDMIFVSLTLYDADLKKNNEIKFSLDTADFFVDFGHVFFQWLALCNLPLDHCQMKKAMWKENISIKGLDYLGRAVETTYLNYIDASLFKDGLFDLEWFEKAVIESPKSYLTHDIKGWAFYKNKAYGKSKNSFKKALKKNPDGMGALAGMMWCYVFEKNKEKAMAFSIAKADVKKDSHESAIKFIEKKFSN